MIFGIKSNPYPLHTALPLTSHPVPHVPFSITSALSSVGNAVRLAFSTTDDFSAFQDWWFLSSSLLIRFSRPIIPLSLLYVYFPHSSLHIL